MQNFPDRIPAARLLVRAWRLEDAPALKDAIDSSIEHLRQWLPWAADEPSTSEAIRQRLERFVTAFDERREWLYGIFPGDFDGRGAMSMSSRVLGGAGLHPRVGSDGLEIGYWLRADAQGQGFATEAVGALTRAAFTVVGIDRLEIRCDPENVRSAAVPRRLGYRLMERDAPNAQMSAGPSRPTMVWRLSRVAFEALAEKEGVRS